MTNKQIIKTLLILAKEKGYTIGEFEKAIGVQVGYFARTKKNEGDIAFRVIRKSVEALELKTFSKLFAELEKYANSKLCPICSNVMINKDDSYYCDKCNIEFKFGSDEE